MCAGVAEGFSCYSICFSEYIFTSSPDCELLTYVIECYNEHREDCESLENSLVPVVNSHEIMGCPSPVSEEVTTSMVTTAEPTTLVQIPPPPPCPKVPTWPLSAPIPSMNSAEILPTFASHDCVVYEPEELQHCSLFGFSTLRAFRSYRSGLETCNIPGSWYLLRHPTVTVEVEGRASGLDFDHTVLSKVSCYYCSSQQCVNGVCANCKRVYKHCMFVHHVRPYAFLVSLRFTQIGIEIDHSKAVFMGCYQID